MQKTKELLPHQSRMLQAPYLFPELRYFFLVAGYGAGKSSNLIDCLLYAVYSLQGKKDSNGNDPRIMLCAITISFLEKSVLLNLEQILKDSDTKYKWNKKNNIIRIGNVDIIVIPIEKPDNVYGYDVCLKEGTLIKTKEGEKPIETIKENDYVLTRKGYKRVLRLIKQGKKECIELKFSNGSDLILTPNHKIITFINEVRADELTKRNKCITINKLYVEKNILQTNTPKLQPVHLIAKTLKEVGQYEVYDLEIEDQHEFFANDILVHNCCAYVDELDELPIHICMEAIDAINQRCRQRVDGFRSPFLQLFSTAQGIKGMYYTIIDFKNKNIPYMLIRARTKDNIYLPPEYIEALYASMNEEQAKCYLDGEFLSVDERRVFPDYKPENNRLDYDFYEKFITDDEYKDIPIYIGMDFNSFGNNAVAAAIIDKAIVFVKDYELGDLREAPNVFRTDFPTQPVTWIPDTTGTQEIIALKNDLEKRGIKIPPIKKNPPVNDRIYACNSLFYMQRMFVCPVCDDLHNSLLKHTRDKKTGEPMKGGKGAPDHKTDCLAYVVSYILRNNANFYDLYSITLGRNFITIKESV